MSMTGYTKLFASIVHSTIWRAPNHTRLVWVTMLALADRDGVVEASIPGLADAARVTLEECEEALQSLMSPDPYSRTKDHEGRRIAEVNGGWLLLNYNVYRDRMSKEHQREQARLRKQKQRSRERLEQATAQQSEGVTPCHAGHEASSKSHSGHDKQTQKQKQKADTKAEGEAEAARARDDHPPPQGQDRTNGDDRRPQRPHPRDRGHTNDVLSPEAEKIHQLLLDHKLPLNSPTGTANHIAGRLGPLGNNKLTVARVRLAVQAVADKSAAAAADGAPRTSEEVRDHLQSFLRYSDGRWKQLEQKLKDDAEADDDTYQLPPDVYHREPEPTPEEREAARERTKKGCAAVIAAVKQAQQTAARARKPPTNAPGSDVES